MGFLKRLLFGDEQHSAGLTQLDYLTFQEQRDQAALDIVGEMSYQAAIAAAIRSRRDIGPKVPFTAIVLPEPANRYDQNALSVVLLHGDGQTATVVGYLSREHAIEYRPVMQRIAPRVIKTTATLKGGSYTSPGEAPLYGAVLHLGTPGELLAELFMSTFSDPPVHRWTGRTVCFTGPSHHAVLGVRLDHEAQEYLARKAGCLTWPRVTKKVQLCVASDVRDETGKLSKAEDYGIEIVREVDFWPGVGLRLEKMT